MPKRTTHAAAASVHYAPPPYISIDVSTGRIIEARNPTHPWYPASVTKLMTVYVALQAVQDGRLSLKTPLIVSARAARMKPSKMGFAPGSLVTLDNALKMLMVKSANDLAVTVAEGVSGSVEAFADEMNQTAAKLGMRESHFMNPNGLPDPNHYSSPRDMAILGRALLLNFPQYSGLFDIGAMKLDDRVIPNHNGLLGRYPGADGMKTGFTCAAGFNLVASATRGGRKVIVVIMGDLTAKIRTAHAADLLDRAFAASQFGEPAAELPAVGGAPPDMHAEICGGRSPKAVLEAESEDFNSPIQAAPELGAGSSQGGGGDRGSATPGFRSNAGLCRRGACLSGSDCRPSSRQYPDRRDRLHHAATRTRRVGPAATGSESAFHASRREKAACGETGRRGQKEGKDGKEGGGQKSRDERKRPPRRPMRKKPPFPRRKPNPQPNRKRKRRQRTPIAPARPPPVRRPEIERLAHRPSPASAHTRDDPHGVPWGRQDDRAEPAPARPRSGAIRRSHQRIRRDRTRPSLRRENRWRHGHDGLGLPVLHACAAI